MLITMLASVVPPGTMVASGNNAYYDSGQSSASGTMGVRLKNTYYNDGQCSAPSTMGAPLQAIFPQYFGDSHQYRVPMRRETL